MQISSSRVEIVNLQCAMSIFDFAHIDVGGLVSNFNNVAVNSITAAVEFDFTNSMELFVGGILASGTSFAMRQCTVFMRI